MTDLLNRQIYKNGCCYSTSIVVPLNFFKEYCWKYGICNYSTLVFKNVCHTMQSLNNYFSGTISNSSTMETFNI